MKAIKDTIKYKSKKEFRAAMAQAMIDSDKSTEMKVLKDLVPALYAIAIMGAANSIMTESLKKTFSNNKKD